MLYLTLDGIPYDVSLYSNLSDTSITIRREDKDGQQLVYGYSEDVEFYGDAYTYIYNKLIAPNGVLGAGVNNTIVVNIYDDCCPTLVEDRYEDSLLFIGKLSTSQLDWCEAECKLTANIEQHDDYVAISNCLKETMVYDYTVRYANGGGFTDQNHPFLWHCAEVRPQFLHVLQLIIAFTFVTILIGIEVILAITLIGIPGIIPLADFISKIVAWALGCNRGHPAPFVRSYITNVCNKCGLTFKSSILNNQNSAYYNVALFSAPVTEGAKQRVSWIDDDKPLETGATFLDKLKQVFNADYRIVGTELVFERKDYFKSNGIWLDVSMGPEGNSAIESICWKYPRKPSPAGAKFQYTLDGIDQVGNEAKNYYNDIVDWNLPSGSYPHLKGIQDYGIPFSPARFRDDGIDADIVSSSSLYAQILGSADAADTPGILRFDGALILSANKCSNYKLLIIDPATSTLGIAIPMGEGPLASNIIALDIYAGDRVLRMPRPLFPTPDIPYIDTAHTNNIQDLKTFYWYNMPMWVSAALETEYLNPNPDPSNPNSYVTDKPYINPDIMPNLYDSFFSIDDPRKQSLADFEVTIVMERSCDIISKISFEQGILLPKGIIGEAKEITIENDKITIKART